MKKRLHLLILAILSTFLCCTNGKKAEPKEATVPADKTAMPTSAVSTVEKLPEAKAPKYASPDGTYSFWTDSLCQTVVLKELAKHNEYGIPAKLGFKLVLHDKLNKQEDRVFEGVAKLFSPEESFGEYFAADYNFEASNYRIKITLDTEGYAACVSEIRAKQRDSLLGIFTVYLKEYPDQGIMKRGNCK